MPTPLEIFLLQRPQPPLKEKVRVGEMLALQKIIPSWDNRMFFDT